MNDLQQTSQKPQISGIVIAAKWNDKGDVTGITIQTHDEKVYLVEPDRIGYELLKFVRKTVTVCGKIREQEIGPALLRVQSYEILADTSNG